MRSVLAIVLWGAAAWSLGTVALAGPQGVEGPTGAEQDVPDYLISPGDVLKVLVWKEAELSGEVSVRLDGKITVPLVGDLRAAGRTTEQLTQEVQERLGTVLEVPQVTVGIAEAASARFYVIGEVAQPGVFALTGRTTVLQALALAGGLREFAKRDRIRIIREEDGQQRAIPFDFDDMGRGENLEQNILVEIGDTIIVP